MFIEEDYVFFKKILAHWCIINGTTLIGFGPILMIAYRLSGNIVIPLIIAGEKAGLAITITPGRGRLSTVWAWTLCDGIIIETMKIAA